jgi:hypothetical protein
MKTTLSKGFEKNFLFGLAGVSKRSSRKQVLESIVSEAIGGVDMAKGLQGRGDWHGAAAKVISSAGLLDQAIDLAETLPGVEFSKTRAQAQLVIKRLGEAMSKLDFAPQEARQQVMGCEEALSKAIDVLRLFTSSLRDTSVCKDGEKLKFDEKLLILKANDGKKMKPCSLKGGKSEPAAGQTKEAKKEISKPAESVDKAKAGKKLKPGSLKGGKSEPAAKAPIGSGERFSALVSQLESKDVEFLDTLEKYTVRDPKALAAAIGRAKYGKKRFQEMAAAGRSKAAKK